MQEQMLVTQQKEIIKEFRESLHNTQILMDEALKKFTQDEQAYRASAEASRLDVDGLEQKCKSRVNGVLTRLTEEDFDDLLPEELDLPREINVNSEEELKTVVDSIINLSAKIDAKILELINIRVWKDKLKVVVIILYGFLLLGSMIYFAIAMSE